MRCEGCSSIGRLLNQSQCVSWLPGCREGQSAEHDLAGCRLHGKNTGRSALVSPDTRSLMEAGSRPSHQRLPPWYDPAQVVADLVMGLPVISALISCTSRHAEHLTVLANLRMGHLRVLQEPRKPPPATALAPMDRPGAMMPRAASQALDRAVGRRRRAPSCLLPVRESRSKCWWVL